MSCDRLRVEIVSVTGFPSRKLLKGERRSSAAIVGRVHSDAQASDEMIEITVQSQ
jgi:hypothetical protein